MKMFLRDERWWYDGRECGLGRHPLVPLGATLGTKNEDVARALFAAIERDAINRQIAGLPVGGTNPAAFAKAHVLSDPAGRRSASHARNLKTDYTKLFSSKALGTLTLEAIRRSHVEAYIAERLESSDPPSPATLRRETMALSLLYSRAIVLGKATANPATKLSAVLPELPEPEPHPLTLAHAKALLHLALIMTRRNKAFGPLVATLLYTGARVGEALRLRVEDIDWGAATVNMPTLKQRTKKRRTRPLRLWTHHAEVLRDWLGERTTGLVFLWGGNQMGSVRRSWAALLNKAEPVGIRADLQVHDLRDTYACLRLSMVESDGRGGWVGVPLSRVSEELGHGSQQVTQDHYATIQKELIGAELDLR